LSGDLRFGAAPSTETGPPITVSRDLIPASDASAANDAFVAAVTQVIALLSRLIGEDTAARLVEEIWPAENAARHSEALLDEQALGSRKKSNNGAGGGATTDQADGAKSEPSDACDH
jgi:hypothetical protein